MNTSAPSKPLKTWSHLSGSRRRPSEYEIVNTRLHYHTENPEHPFEVGADCTLNEWYRKYRTHSALQHDDWDAFRDPDEQVYRTYNLVQDGQENYVQGLFDQFSDRGHDQTLSDDWLQTLARAYTPARYLYHTAQMASAYITTMAPASTISTCATFQAADCLRWLSHTAYRTAELAKSHPAKHFGEGERTAWEQDPCWQGFRELMEKGLVAWDWGEAFAVLNLVAKPAINIALHQQLGQVARHEQDTLLALLSDAQSRDSERHDRWTEALVGFIAQRERNVSIIQGWLAKWRPLAEQAISAYCGALPGGETSQALDRFDSTVNRWRTQLQAT